MPDERSFEVNAARYVSMRLNQLLDARGTLSGFKVSEYTAQVLSEYKKVSEEERRKADLEVGS